MNDFTVIASSTNYVPLIGLIVTSLIMWFRRMMREGAKAGEEFTQDFQRDPEFRKLVQERAQLRGIVIPDPPKPKNKDRDQ